MRYCTAAFTTETDPEVRLIAQARAAILTCYCTVVITATGSEIQLDDGTVVKDAVGGAAVCCIGNNNAKVRRPD